jgi:tRNA(Ile)-lysidine synthase
MSGREVFDAGVVGDQITLRRWQPGDRFQPIGLKAAAKLQDLFTNQKIPAAQRRQLIVATTESGEVFWVEGLRIGEVAKVRAGTRRRLTWLWQRTTAKRSLQAPAHRASVAHLTNHG